MASSNSNSDSTDSGSEFGGLVRAEYPELFFGLVGALGADLRQVTSALQENLRRVGYENEFIKATDLLQGLSKFRKLDRGKFSSIEDRINAYMDAGNRLRKLSDRRDIMAMLCVAEIRRKRRLRNIDDSEETAARKPVSKVAYIVYSLKTPEEVDLLKAVYGRAFYIISAYASRERRLTSIAEQLKASAQATELEEFAEPARKLINRDEKETTTYGQNVRGCFPRGDVFIDASERERLQQGIQRFLELVFGNSFITPSKDEFAMFHTYSAALRSADLGRQVGAVIASEEGDVISVGCNEVPKAKGGLYWEGDEPDDRDFKRGHDSSDVNRYEMIAELVKVLRSNRWLNPEKIGGRSTKSVTKMFLDKKEKGNLRGTRIMSVIEYGRAVHAEMAALMDAARRGTRVSGSTMYCTTFPCHLCARHIISSGVTRLVYVEPYPKSQAEQMYKDSMVVDNEMKKDGFVSFEPFVGIAPKLYDFVFKMTSDRKSDETGDVLEWSATDARPKLERFAPSYIFLEDNVLGFDLPDGLKRAKISILNN